MNVHLPQVESNETLPTPAGRGAVDFPYQSRMLVDAEDFAVELPHDAAEMAWPRIQAQVFGAGDLRGFFVRRFHYNHSEYENLQRLHDDKNRQVCA